MNQLLTMYRLHEQTASTKVRHWCRTENCSLGGGGGGGLNTEPVLKPDHAFAMYAPVPHCAS